MDKKQFCTIMEELHEGYRLQRKIANAVRQYNNIIHNDFPEPYGMVCTHEWIVQELLEEVMDDRNGDIDWWCNEIEYGENYTPGDVVVDGNEIELRTAEQLYDFLVCQQEERINNENKDKN